jgi:hypothetical protein
MSGEDQRSIDKHLAALKSELKKGNPDNALLADKMKRTVYHRKKICLEKTTSEALDAFPCLQQHVFVSIHQSYYHFHAQF